MNEETLANEPAALGIEEHVDRDEQEDWEYEYSTTETEARGTYYLTVELSYPEFKDRQSRRPHHSRGGYYKTWLDRHAVNLRDAAGAATLNEADDNDDEPLPEAEPDDDEPEIDPELRDKGKEVDDGGQDDEADKAQEDDKELEDIQVLDLHSKQPIISYKGRVFEGQWAEVIGTEAIFANHDAENTLPALRRLPGHVDLLGASASRILTKETILKPKVPKEDPLAAIREEWNIRIPVGKDRTGERAQQTRFLENLMALKKKKGETDLVTIYAKDGAGKDFKDNRDPDYKPRRKRRIFDENGQEVFPKRDKKTRGGRRAMGRPRIRGGRRGGSVVGSRGTESAGPSTLSTPTPSRWMDLEEKDDKDDEDEVAEETDDEEDEDVSMAD
ncbi:Fc.00g099400.m01.CDS01 [Cosmosporella sp. VM-42]